MRNDILEATINGVTYKVEDPLYRDGLKATVTVLDDACSVVASDRLNLDQEKTRGTFAKKADVSPDDLFTLRGQIADWLVPPSETATETQPEPTPEAQGAALELLDSPSLLHQAGDTATLLGYAGNTDRVKLVLLAFVSRLLERPLNLLITGPSGAGKNHLVQKTAALLPPWAIHVLSGSSERALVYTEMDLRHKVLVIEEASALHRDGIGASLIRGLSWDGRLSYATTDKTTAGLKGRKIEIEGPIALVTTTTGTLEDELATRMLTVTIPGDPATTMTINMFNAARFNGRAPQPPDLVPWHAAQWWLEARGGRTIIIPYSEAVAERYPANLVRSRRDVPQLLTLIEAHALLYQRQRERDASGRIIADRRDYEAIFSLVADVFGAIAAEGVTPVLRETVAKVGDLTPNPDDTVTVAQLARALERERSTIQKRVTRLLAGGWLTNHETRERRPAQLRAGDALPADRPALPLPDELFDRGHTPRRIPSQLPRSHYADLPHIEAEKSGNSGSSLPVPTFPPSTEPVREWEVCGNTPDSHSFPDADAENADSGNVGAPDKERSCSPTIETDIINTTFLPRM